MLFPDIAPCATMIPGQSVEVRGAPKASHRNLQDAHVVPGDGRRASLMPGPRTRTRSPVGRFISKLHDRANIPCIARKGRLGKGSGSRPQPIPSEKEMAARVSRRSMAGGVAIAAEYGLRCDAVLAAPQHATEFTDKKINRDATGAYSGPVSRAAVCSDRRRGACRATPQTGRARSVPSDIPNQTRRSRRDHI
jgi:hypothetical protein